MQRLLKYLAILTLCFCNASAQLLPFKTYTTKEGLISNEITSVIRDDRGLLWIGTAFGINWYDGNRFTEPEIKTNSGQLYVTGFLQDNTKHIWVLTFYNGVYKYDKERFSNFLPHPHQIESNSNSIFDMVQYDDSTFLVATDQNIFWFDGTSFTAFDKDNASLRVQFNTIGSAKNKWLFFGNSGGIMVYQKENGHWKYASRVFAGYEINKILIEKEHAWITTNKGLLFFDKVEDILKGKPAKTVFENRAVSGITKNAATGDLWISSDKLYRVSDNVVQSYGLKEGLPAIPGYTYFDQENITWLCSANGLTKLVKENNIFYDLRIGPSHSMINMIAKDERNNIWLGSYDGLAYKTNDQFVPLRSVQGQKIGYVSWLLKTKTNEMLAGTQLGILLVRKDKLVLKNKLRTTKAFEDEEGTIWMGTETGKLHTLKGDEFSEILMEDPVADYIDAVYRDKNGNIWVGYRSYGIRKYNAAGQSNSLKIVKEYSHKTGFSDLRVRCSFADNSGNILFGTRTNGIFIISGADNDHAWHINKDKGLTANWVKSIARDESGTIYLATNKGMNVLRGTYGNPTVNKINLSNEELTDKTTFVFPDKEKIWIGTENGIVEYFPGIDTSGVTAPVIYITELSVNGKPDTSLGTYISSFKKHFDPGNNIIGFEFAGVDLKNDASLQYRYKLEGQDNDWTYAGQRNFVTYNLPAGNYTFLAQARSTLSKWSDNPATVSFTIPAPFWKKWWFFTSILLIVAAISFLVYRYRVQQALKLERLRSRISTDLHDDIGSTLSSISILSEMAAHEKDRQQSSEMMQEIKQSSVSLMEKMDDIVWSINPRNDSIEDLMLRIKRFAARLFEAKDIDYTIHIDDTIHAARLDMESRQHIYLIMKEAINNLVKYAECTRADIAVKFRQNILDIRIRDNGKGFIEQNIRLGNGIISMRKRAEAIRGDISIVSAKEKGTVVSLQTKIK